MEVLNSAEYKEATTETLEEKEERRVIRNENLRIRRAEGEILDDTEFSPAETLAESLQRVRFPAEDEY